ncbi:MAG TPA: D-glycerate dehydrogenase [Acidimicrobiales bacterium]|nr:D-glycerate dehydrogenase [Acidimicrobiales bacterium]
MARVLVTRRMPPGSLDPLLDAGHELVGPPRDDRPMSAAELRIAAADVDAVVCLLTDRIDRSVVEVGRGRVRVIANVAVGVDNIDVAAAAEAGIAVCNTPGVLDEATADLAFLLILAASRRTTEAEADLRAGRWAGWNINDHLGQDVHGRRLGVVGWGRIGRVVATRAAGFGMTVRHHARRPTGDEGFVADLDDLLRWADVVSLHVPLGPESHHLVDARRLGLMKATSVLVNTSRGPVVDEAALAAALHAGTIFAAGLDVFEDEPAVHPELVRAPGAVLLPHIGSATVRTRTAMGRLAAESVVDLLAGRTPATVVAP